MKVVRCSEDTYSFILEHAAQHRIPIARAVDELVGGRLEGQQSEDREDLGSEVLVRLQELERSTLRSISDLQSTIRHLATEDRSGRSDQDVKKLLGDELPHGGISRYLRALGADLAEIKTVLKGQVQSSLEQEIERLARKNLPGGS